MIKRNFITTFVILPAACLSLCHAQLIFPWFYPVQFAYYALGGAGNGASFPDVGVMGADDGVRIIPVAPAPAGNAPPPPAPLSTPPPAVIKPETPPPIPPDDRKDVREIKKMGGIVMAANPHNGPSRKKDGLLKFSLQQFAKSDIHQ